MALLRASYVICKTWQVSENRRMSETFLATFSSSDTKIQLEWLKADGSIFVQTC